MRISKQQLRDEAARFCAELEEKASWLNVSAVVALYGELGSGKTAFVKEVGRYFSIREPIISPTFVIEKIYRLEGQKFENLVHIDAYRLESGDELLSLGWQDLLKESSNLIVVEWADNISEILPNKRWDVRFEFVDEEIREMEIQKFSN